MHFHSSMLNTMTENSIPQLQTPIILHLEFLSNLIFHYICVHVHILWF